MTRKTKSPVDLIADLLASVQESEKKYVIELRSFAHALADANDGMAGMKCENDKLRAENTKLRKKLARVTKAATESHRLLAAFTHKPSAGYAPADAPPNNMAPVAYGLGVMPCDGVHRNLGASQVSVQDGIEIHGNLDGVDLATAVAVATGAVSWPPAASVVETCGEEAWALMDAAAAMLNAKSASTGAWAGMAAFGDNT